MATGEIIGKVNIPTKTALYEGKETDTANVLVNNVDKTIAVNVKVDEVTSDCAKSIESTQDENTVELSLKNDADEVISSTTFNVESSPIIDSKNITEYDDASLKKLYRDIPAQGEDVKDSIYYVNKEYVHYTREVNVSDEITNFGTGSELNASQIFQCLGGDVDTLINSVINVSTQEEQIPFKVFPQYESTTEMIDVPYNELVQGETYTFKQLYNIYSSIEDKLNGESLSLYFTNSAHIEAHDDDGQFNIGADYYGLWFGDGEWATLDDTGTIDFRDDEFLSTTTINQFNFTFNYVNSATPEALNGLIAKEINVITDKSFKLGASKAKGVLGFELKPGIHKVTLGVKVWGNDATPSIIVNGEEIAINPESDAIQEIEVNLTDNKLILETIVMSGKAKRFTLHYIKQTLQGDAVYTKQYLGTGSSDVSLDMPTISMSGISSSHQWNSKSVMYNPDYYTDVSENNFYITIKVSNADALKAGDEVQLCRYVKKFIRLDDGDGVVRCRYRYRRIYGVALTDEDIETIKKTNVYTLKLDYDVFVRIYKYYDSRIKDLQNRNFYLSLARDNLYMRVLRRIDDDTGEIDDSGFKSSGKSLSVSCKLPLLVIDGHRDINQFPESDRFTQFTIRTHSVLDAETITNNKKDQWNN